MPQKNSGNKLHQEPISPTVNLASSQKTQLSTSGTINNLKNYNQNGIGSSTGGPTSPKNIPSFLQNSNKMKNSLFVS